MAREISVPWPSNPTQMPGVRISEMNSSIRQGDDAPELTITHPAVSFANLSAAIDYFGGEDNVINYLGKVVTQWHRNRAAAAAKNASPEKAITGLVNSLVRAFVRKRGREPNASEIQAIKAKAKALMEDSEF